MAQKKIRHWKGYVLGRERTTYVSNRRRKLNVLPPQCSYQTQTGFLCSSSWLLNGLVQFYPGIFTSFLVVFLSLFFVLYMFSPWFLCLFFDFLSFFLGFHLFFVFLFYFLLPFFLYSDFYYFLGFNQFCGFSLFFLIFYFHSLK